VGIIVLEFSHPTDKVTEKVYDFYSFKLLPKIGKIIAKDEDSYRYLAESPSIVTSPEKNERAGLELSPIKPKAGNEPLSVVSAVSAY
jgi:demethylmenaquinone methyltransferase/2-methoxy-6-polyprenyl-1,4-benzoquinol methylase